MGAKVFLPCFSQTLLYSTTFTAGFSSEYGKTELDDVAVQGYSSEFCIAAHFKDEKVKISPFQEKVQVSLPNEFEDNLSCASSQTGNDGIGPGESGSTIGMSRVYDNIAYAALPNPYTVISLL